MSYSLGASRDCRIVGQLGRPITPPTPTGDAVSAFCDDCGMDTEPWPPHRGTQEHYIVRDEVWASAGMKIGHISTDDLTMRGGGTLCVSCIENRLGRLLSIGDFAPHTLSLLKKSCESTPRLLSRAGVAFMAVANEPLPDHIVDQWVASTLRNVLRDHGHKLKSVEVNGDEVILVYKREAVRYRAGPGLKALVAYLRWDRETAGEDV